MVSRNPDNRAEEEIAGRESTGRWVTYRELDRQMVHDTPLIINTTPLGMYPDVKSCPDIPYAALTPAHLLFDLVYNPTKTAFLAKGERRGSSVVNGYEMLILQAEASWKIWNSERKAE
jgi:shikimate dehydrogenase